MSIEECRKYIPDKNLSDKEVEKIRDDIYALGKLAIEMYIKEKLSGKKGVGN